jgi:hypothetical protein
MTTIGPGREWKRGVALLVCFTQRARLLSRILGMQIASATLVRPTVGTNTDTVELVWTGVACANDENILHSRSLGPTPSVIRGAGVLYRGFS